MDRDGVAWTVFTVVGGLLLLFSVGCTVVLYLFGNINLGQLIFRSGCFVVVPPLGGLVTWWKGDRSIGAAVKGFIVGFCIVAAAFVIR